jgi:hypothetical protein
MASNPNNVKLGVCQVIYGGVDLGYTKGGVEVEVQTSTHEVKVDQLGETPIGELVTGRQVTVKVPLAETTLDNLVAIMPGATLVGNGVKASGTVTFSTAPPINGDKVTVAGIDFTWKTVPTEPTDMPIAATLAAAAAALADAVTLNLQDYNGSAVGAVCTITAAKRGTAGNTTLSKTVGTAANVTTTASILGGTNSTNGERVDVKTGVNVNLLSLAQVLRLRPIGSDGSDDFIVYKAAAPGALSFAYKLDDERVFMANFKGYPDSLGRLFGLGLATAT